MWIYNETSEFVRCCEDLSLSKDVREAIEAWAKTTGRVQTNKTKLYFRSPKNIFDIWDARIPDPDHNKGSSGGFRLVYFFNLTESSIYVDKIDRRADRSGRKEHPKTQQVHEKYLRELKLSLVRDWEN